MHASSTSPSTGAHTTHHTSPPKHKKKDNQKPESTGHFGNPAPETVSAVSAARLVLDPWSEVSLRDAAACREGADQTERFLSNTYVMHLGM